MPHKFFNCFIVSFGLFLIISFLSSYSNLTPMGDTHKNENQNLDHILDKDSPGVPKGASSEPNGKPLIINQYANISSTTSFSNIRSGDNVSYTLTQGWTSKNTTVNFEGVSKKEQIIVNGAFDSDDSGWVYKTNTGDLKKSWDGTEGTPVKDGCTAIESSSNIARYKGDYGYFEQNISLQNEELRDDPATFSFNYNKDWSNSFNASLFMSVIIGNIEINQSVYA